MKETFEGIMSRLAILEEPKRTADTRLMLTCGHVKL